MSPHIEIFRSGRWQEWPGTRHRSDDANSEKYQAAEEVIKGGTKDGVFVREMADDLGELCQTHEEAEFSGTSTVAGPPAIKEKV